MKPLGIPFFGLRQSLKYRFSLTLSATSIISGVVALGFVEKIALL
jgi:hypothetical protein